MSPVDTTVVVPCYNEADRLDTAAFARFAEGHRRFGFLFVDDGSTDATLEVLRRLERALPAQFSVLHLPRNLGKAEAVRIGTRHALRRASRYIGYWDADLATPLDALLEFQRTMDEREGTLLVMGARVRLLGRRIERRPIRHYLGRVFATAVSLLLGLEVYDTQCGAKLFRASPEVSAIFSHPFVSRWFFDVELLARLQGLVRERDLRVVEIPLVQWMDIAGSRLRARDFVRAPLDLLRIRLGSRAAADPQRIAVAPCPAQIGGATGAAAVEPG